MLYDYEAASEGELTIRSGEIVVVVTVDAGDGWMEGQNSNGEKGVFPASYVSLM